MSRELIGVTANTDRDGHRWVVSGRPRAAPGLHVTTVVISAQARLPRWLVESTDTLRIIVRPSGLATRDVPAFTALPNFQLLDTLIVRLAVGGFALARLSFWLARTDPPTCPSLRVLVLSILNPRCTLDALRPLYKATTHRAGLGHPLQRLFVCSPVHASPDYTIRYFHGVEWVTFSSTDVGAPCRDVPRSTRASDGGTPALAVSQPCEEPPPFSESAVYDAAWEACATEGLVETHARMHACTGTGVRVFGELEPRMIA